MRCLLGVATLLATMGAYLSHHTARKLFLDNLQEQALQQVEQSSNQLDQWLLARKTETLTLANTPTLRSMDWQQVEPFLKPELGRLTDFYFFALIQPDGSYHNTKVGFAQGQNIGDRKHVKMALAGRNYVSDPVLSRTLDIPIVAVTAPIWASPPPAPSVLSPSVGGEDGQTPVAPVGVLAGLISIDQLIEVVDNLHYGPGSYAFALNSEGLAIAHPDPALMSTLNDQAPTRLTELAGEGQGELAAIAQRMIKRETDIEKIQVEGKTVYVAFLPLAEADWSMGLVIPQQNIESQLRLIDLLAILVVSFAAVLLALLWRIQRSEQQRLRESKALADAANQAKSEFLSNMSHELRTPLNAILGFSQLMQADDTLASRHREHLHVINRSGEHLLQLINDVLTMAKIEVGRAVLEPNSFSLYGFLNELRSMLKLKAQEKGLNLVVEPDGNLPPYIEADEGKLRQILLNLLNNALKFTESGYVRLKVTLQPLPDPPPDSCPDPQSLEPRVGLRFSVSDSGPGIRPEELDNLFVPFVQTETGKRSHQGTGLGLSISRKFARMMQGDVTLESRWGEGSTFHCDVWVQVAQSISQANVAQEQVIGLAEGQPRYRMVVAEDHLQSRQLLVHLLTRVGFEVREAQTGAEAVSLCHHWQPQVLWMDLRMPERDGLSAARAIKTAAQANNQPSPLIIAVTANAFESDRSQAYAAGFDDFIAKPYHHSLIFETLATHLSVQYRYADPQPTHPKPLHLPIPWTLSPEDLQPLPPSWHEQLRQAIHGLDHAAIEQCLTQVRSPILRQSLQELARDFSYDHLLDLLQIDHSTDFPGKPISDTEINEADISGAGVSDNLCRPGHSLLC